MVASPAIADEISPQTGEIQVVYLSTAGQQRALVGARLGILDDNGTGRFLGQSFSLREMTVSDEKPEAAPSWSLIVADLPAPQLLALADLPALRQTTILDV